MWSWSGEEQFKAKQSSGNQEKDQHNPLLPAPHSIGLFNQQPLAQEAYAEPMSAEKNHGSENKKMHEASLSTPADLENTVENEIQFQTSIIDMTPTSHVTNEFGVLNTTSSTDELTLFLQEFTAHFEQDQKALTMSVDEFSFAHSDAAHIQTQTEHSCFTPVSEHYETSISQAVISQAHQGQSYYFLDGTAVTDGIEILPAGYIHHYIVMNGKAQVVYTKDTLSSLELFYVNGNALDRKRYSEVTEILYSANGNFFVKRFIPFENNHVELFTFVQSIPKKRKNRNATSLAESQQPKDLPKKQSYFFFDKSELTIPGIKVYKYQKKYNYIKTENGDRFVYTSLALQDLETMYLSNGEPLQLSQRKFVTEELIKINSRWVMKRQITINGDIYEVVTKSEFENPKKKQSGTRVVNFGILAEFKNDIAATTYFSHIFTSSANSNATEDATLPSGNGVIDFRPKYRRRKDYSCLRDFKVHATNPISMAPNPEPGLPQATQDDIQPVMQHTSPTNYIPLAPLQFFQLSVAHSDEKIQEPSTPSIFFNDSL